MQSEYQRMTSGEIADVRIRFQRGETEKEIAFDLNESIAKIKRICADIRRENAARGLLSPAQKTFKRNMPVADKKRSLVLSAYVGGLRTPTLIAKQVGVSAPSVRKYLRDAGLPCKMNKRKECDATSNTDVR